MAAFQGVTGGAAGAASIRKPRVSGRLVARDKQEQDQWTMLLADGRYTWGSKIEVFLASCFREVSVQSFGVC